MVSTKIVILFVKFSVLRLVAGLERSELSSIKRVKQVVVCEIELQYPR